jgi:ligand-binding sensor domain-containing protein/DNA-binding CsgD family transcriptional regulator
MVLIFSGINKISLIPQIMLSKISTVLIIFALLLKIQCFGQLIINRTGLPFIENYSRLTFGGGIQTWSITQDNRGILYLANNSGVLEFDGSNWRLHPMENSSIVRKVFKSKTGKIYIGAFNEFGYLYTDDFGSMKYYSLSNLLPPENKEFGEIWSIIESEEGIIFQSFSATFFYKDTLHVLNYNEHLNFGFFVRGRYYQGNNNQGLTVFDNNKFSPVKDGEIFRNLTVSGMIEFQDNEILVGTSFNGFFLFDGQKIIPWKNPASDFIIKNQLYSLLKLEDGIYAAGTIKNGLIFFNNEGKIIQQLDKETGLQNNSVLALFLDKEKNLWIGLDNGIDMIKLNSPVSMLFRANEYGAGYVSCIQRDNIYFGTNQGLYFSNRKNIINTTQKADLVPVINASGQVWNLQVIDTILICGHHNGAFEVIDNKAYQVSNELGFWKFLKLRNNLVIASTYNGLVLFKIEKNSFPHLRFIKKISGFNESCREMEVDNSGNIWLSHPYRGIFKIRLNNDCNEIVSINCYNKAKGLPSDYLNSVFQLDNNIQALTKGAIYYYNAQSDTFEVNKKLSIIFNNEPVDKICKDDFGNIWYFQKNELGILRSNFDGLFYAEKVPFNGLKGSFIPYYENVLSVENKSLILSSEFGFVFFDKTKTAQINKDFNILIRTVTTNSGELLYNGSKIPNQFTKNENSNSEPITYLPHNRNYMQFIVSAAIFADQERTQYNYWLQGSENDWSGWTKLNFKEYSRLESGTYTFHVKSRNQFNVETTEATYSFVIKKPWYWNAFSISFYCIATLGLIFMIFRIIFKRYANKKEQLTLKQAEIFQKKEKELEYENIMKEKEIIRLKNENLLFENDRNKILLESKTKELASIAMKISSNNEVILKTSDQLQKVHRNMVHEESKKQVSILIKNLEHELEQNDNWKQFEIHFDKVHENFLKHLRTEYPSLTSKDLKMAAYLRMNMSSKEIAQLFSLTYRGVETSRFRLRKKLQLSKDVNLTDFLMKLSNDGA